MIMEKDKTDKNNIVSGARMRLGMTQAELGKAIGRSACLIYKIEAKECSLSRYVVEAVRRLLVDRGLAADPYSGDEREILIAYRGLSTADKAHVAAIIRGLAETRIAPRDAGE